MNPRKLVPLVPAASLVGGLSLVLTDPDFFAFQSGAALAFFGIFTLGLLNARRRDELKEQREQLRQAAKELELKRQAAQAAELTRKVAEETERKYAELMQRDRDVYEYAVPLATAPLSTAGPLFRPGAYPVGYPMLSEEQIEKARAKLAEALRSRKPMVIRSDVSYTPIKSAGVPPMQQLARLSVEYQLDIGLVTKDEARAQIDGLWRDYDTLVHDFEFLAGAGRAKDAAETWKKLLVAQDALTAALMPDAPPDVKPDLKPDAVARQVKAELEALKEQVQEPEDDYVPAGQAELSASLLAHLIAQLSSDKPVPDGACWLMTEEWLGEVRLLVNKQGRKLYRKYAGEVPLLFGAPVITGEEFGVPALKAP